MSENTNTATKQTWLDKALTVVENVCNKLPDPVILFCWLFLFTAIIGTIATVAGVSLINGSRFITPMQAPVRQRRIRESMFIFLYTGYIAGIVMRTVTAVVPSR